MTKRKVDNPKRVISVSVKAIIYDILKNIAEKNGTTMSRIVEPMLEEGITKFVSASSKDGDCASINHSERQDEASYPECDPALQILKEVKKDVEEDNFDKKTV